MTNKKTRPLPYRYPDVKGKDLDRLKRKLRRIRENNSAVCTKYPNFCSILDYETLNDERPRAGVWAVFGKKEDSPVWNCLQVCETSNMTKEIMNDIGLIQSNITVDDKVEYINQEGKSLFSHPVHLQNAAKWAFVDIRDKYSKIAVVLIALEEDAKERSAIEQSFAKEQKAVYWRSNNRPQGKKNI